MSSAFVFNNALSGDDAKSYVAMMAQLDAVLSASADLIPPAINSPSADSPMGTAYKRMLRDPYEQASLLWMSSEDHLRTVLGILQSNLLPIFSLYSLLRPAAEADVRMAYLLDATITERERLGRGLNVRFESLREQNKVKPDAAHFAARSANIEKRAKDNRIVPLRSNAKKGAPEIIGFGETIQQEIPLFQTYHAGKELLYRVLCSHVHSRPWAWMDSSKAVATPEPGVALFKAELDIRLYVSILVLTLTTHERALVRFLELAGNTKADWDRAKEAHIDRVRPSYMERLKTV